MARYSEAENAALEQFMRDIENGDVPAPSEITGYMTDGTTIRQAKDIYLPIEWPPLVRLDDDPILPAFPVDCLPDALRRYVNAVAESVQVPVDMAATCGLSVCALCLQRKFKVCGKPDWYEPINLYSVVVAAPAERKSAVTSLMTEPLYRYEETRNEFLQPEIDEYEIKHSVLVKKVKNLEDAAAKPKKTGKGSPLEWNSALDDSMDAVLEKKRELAQLEANEPKALRLWTDDVTMEALTSLLADNGGRMGIISAEGGIFETLNGRYTNGVNIDIFLKAHAGDSVRVDRKGRASEYIKNPAMTVFLAIQPSVLDGLMSNEAFRGRGLTARFLYSMPTSTIGGRDFESFPIADSVKEEYAQLVNSLLAIEQPAKESIINLSESAYDQLKAFFYELEPRLKDDLEAMGDWAGKLAGAVLRIAGILHTIQHQGKADTVFVAGDTMSSAIRIGRYFLEHAQSVYRLMGADAQSADARYVFRRLEAYQYTEISGRELLRLCQRFSTVEEIQPAIDLLIEYGYLREAPAIYKGAGRKPSPKYEINPEAYMTQMTKRTEFTL